MLTGLAARRTTWVVMDEWITQHSTPDERAEEAGPARKRAPRKASARKTAGKSAGKSAGTTTRKTTARKTTARAKKAAPSGTTPASTDAAKPTPDRGAIGSNPERRFSSRASRSLAPKR
jgi:polyhydroxyalkanoate synthase